MYWAAKQHCVAQSQRSVAGRFPRQQWRGREGQQQKQWRRGLRGYQRLILRVRLRLAAKSWKDTKHKTLRNKGLLASCNNLIFFFLRRGMNLMSYGPMSWCLPQTDGSFCSIGGFTCCLFFLKFLAVQVSWWWHAQRAWHTETWEQLNQLKFEDLLLWYHR